ncbi:HAD family hydrolase [Sphingobium bisphenolivorans]|uniref:HAD family hydrolase n=1 Tax=Sphingobium bisphenolivorans TaxID=1335760 RepID=UPI0003A6568C|nr:HAD family phosphatase [Sphingobium bisphenolivorans]
MSPFAAAESARLARPLPDPVRAVIFDMDGTLLDTEALHKRTMAQASAALGWPLTEEMLLGMVGIPRHENREMLARLLGPGFPLERFYAESDVLFEAALHEEVPFRPGAQAALAAIATAGIRMAIATSTSTPFAQERLARAGILSCFDVVITRNDVARAKPDPEPYLLAASRLDVAVHDAVAVEDSYAGVRSASAAGIPTIMVPDLLPPTEQELRAVTAVLPSLDALAALIL